MKEKEYQKSFIAYLDILGFKSIIERNSCNSVYDILTEFGRKSTFYSDANSFSFRLTEKELVDYQPKKTERIINFSDTVIWCYPILFEQNSVGFKLAFINVLNLLHGIQSEFFRRGIPIRGGLTVGSIFIEGNMFYGPGLVEACLLEKKANYPRIILHPRLNHDVRKLPSNRIFIESSGGKKFISHFYDSIFVLTKMEKDMAETLKDLHVRKLMSYKALIVDGLNSKPKNVQKKYKWLEKRYRLAIQKIAEAKSSILTSDELRTLII